MLSGRADHSLRGFTPGSSWSSSDARLLAVENRIMLYHRENLAQLLFRHAVHHVSAGQQVPRQYVATHKTFNRVFETLYRGNARAANGLAGHDLGKSLG